MSVLLEGASKAVDGFIMHKVTDENLIIVTVKTGKKVSIPKEKVRFVMEDE